MFRSKMQEVLLFLILYACDSGTSLCRRQLGQISPSKRNVNHPEPAASKIKPGQPAEPSHAGSGNRSDWEQASLHSPRRGAQEQREQPHGQQDLPLPATAVPGLDTLDQQRPPPSLLHEPASPGRANGRQDPAATRRQAPRNAPEAGHCGVSGYGDDGRSDGKGRVVVAAVHQGGEQADAGQGDPDSDDGEERAVVAVALGVFSAVVLVRRGGGRHGFKPAAACSLSWTSPPGLHAETSR